MAFKYSEEEYKKDRDKKKKKEDTLQDIEAGFRKAKESKKKAWENF